MGIAIPQVVSKSTTSGSGAQVIDGSLKFDEDKNTYLQEHQVLLVIVELGLGVVGLKRSTLSDSFYRLL